MARNGDNVRLACVVGVVHIGATGCLLFLLTHYSLTPLFTWNALFWLALSMAAHYLPIPIFSSGSPNTISPGFVVSAAILVVFNPLVGAVVLSLGALNQRDLTRSRPLYQTIYCRSMYVICATVGAELFEHLPGGEVSTAAPENIIARMVPMILAYFLCNTSMVRARVAAEDNEPFFEHYPFRGDLLVGYLFMGVLSMIVVLLARIHPALAVTVIGPIWGWRFALGKLIELRELNDQLVQSFADALDMRDHETAGHTRRVASLARLIGKQLKLSRRQLNDIYAAGSLHDLGKIGIPDSILLKPGRLSHHEFEEMKKHPVMGALLLAPYRHLRNVTDIMRHHHERFDGGGYPDGLAAADIPIGARVIAVADTFMVITDGRPYQPARTASEAIAELRRCSGTQFDPQVVAALLALDPAVILQTLGAVDNHDDTPVLEALQPNALWARVLHAKVA
jgi:HD-GYP domain-containing protein (c-di-GMP phosphodiesterase class II)